VSIAVTCDCGRSIKVKDEMAGKKGRCPSCNAVLSIPEVSSEEPDFELVETEDDHKSKKVNLRRYRDEPEEEERPTRRRAKRDEDEEDEDDRPVRRRSSREEEDERPRRSARAKPDSDEYKITRKVAERRRDPDPPRPRPRRRTRRAAYSGGGGGGGGGGFNVNGGAMIGGIIVMLVAVVWFVVGLMFDYLFFFPPVLFLIGVIGFIKGILGHDDDD
jgi:hypothetical protein